MSLPPDVLATLGGPGRFEINDLNRDGISMERVLSERITIEGNVEMVLAPACPACAYVYPDSTEEECPVCGASRPLIVSS